MLSFMRLLYGKMYLWVSVLSSSSLNFTENLGILGVAGGVKNWFREGLRSKQVSQKVIILNKIMIEAKARLTLHFQS